MMRSKRAIRTLNCELAEAIAAAVKETELVHRKRKALMRLRKTLS